MFLYLKPVTEPKISLPAKVLNNIMISPDNTDLNYKKVPEGRIKTLVNKIKLKVLWLN